jgi:hypothetical protein
VESYFKRMYNLIEYREGARLLLNDNFERELLNGDGRSFGVEWFLRKETGKLTGWLSYTWSKTERQFAQLNGGRPYPDRFDRCHAISAVGVSLRLAHHRTERTVSDAKSIALRNRFVTDLHRTQCRNPRANTPVGCKPHSQKT